MNNIIGIVIALAVVVAGGLVYMNSQSATDSTNTDTLNQVSLDVMEKEGEDEMMKDEEMMKDGDVIEKENEEMEKEDAMEKTETEVMIKSEDVMEKEGEDEMMKDEETVTVTTPGTFTAFSESKLAAAQGDIVLSFTADWCPSCRALEADIQANAGDIPSDLTILDLDYDSATELKRKYGVTTQHTLVQVDNQGNMIQTWRGGNTLSALVAQVN